MNASISWIKDALFVARSASGHTVFIDGPPDHGGKNLGVRPMEMVLMALGGCTSLDVVDILKKSRQDVTECVTQLTAERADTIPAVFTRIHIHFTVTGKNLKTRQVARAVELSATKYCSATMMLERGGVAITHAFDIVDASGPAAVDVSASA
jgi:putative redox protein